MMTDPIADMLTRIRNAVRVERATVEVPSSKVKRGVADVLKREGYIWDWREVESEPEAKLQLELKYGPNGERLIRHIKRVSSPGRRVYSRSVRLKPVLGGLGISIGKLDLYVAAGGFHPRRILPCVIDVGTNNEKLINDPAYLGLKQPRLGKSRETKIICLF